MAKFEVGHEKIAGSGRKKGTNQARTIIAEGLIERIPRLFEEMDKMHGAPFVAAWNNTANYAFPKLSAVKVDDNGKAATMIDLIKQTAEYHREERGK